MKKKRERPTAITQRWLKESTLSRLQSSRKVLSDLKIHAHKCLNHKAGLFEAGLR